MQVTMHRVLLLGSTLMLLAAGGYGAREDGDGAGKAIVQGNEAFEKGDLDLAVSCYTEAIRLDPKFAEAYHFRGLAYGITREHDKAIADYSEAIRLDPKFAKAYYNRGWAYVKKGDLDKAIADYTEAIRLDPRSAAAYHLRGSAYEAKGDREKARADYEEAKKLGWRKK